MPLIYHPGAWPSTRPFLPWHTEINDISLGGIVEIIDDVNSRVLPELLL